MIYFSNTKILYLQYLLSGLLQLTYILVYASLGQLSSHYFKCCSYCSKVARVFSSGASISCSTALLLSPLFLPLKGFPILTESVCRTELSSGEELLRPLREKDVVLLSELVPSKSLPMKLNPAWRMCELPANT